MAETQPKPEDKDEQSEQKESIVDFFRNSPFVGLDLDITRGDDYGRDIDFGPDDEAKPESDKK